MSYHCEMNCFIKNVFCTRVCISERIRYILDKKTYHIHTVSKLTKSCVMRSRLLLCRATDKERNILKIAANLHTLVFSFNNINVVITYNVEVIQSHDQNRSTFVFITELYMKYF